MSLFENESYRWRETYFVLLNEAERFTVERAKKLLKDLGANYELGEIRGDADGKLEFLTLYSPDDYAALDISYVTGEDVTQYLAELKDELQAAGLAKDEKARFQKLAECNARYDIYHFEQVVEGTEEEDEFIDPGSLLIVLEKLARLCHGVAVDPQSGSLL